MQPREYLVSIFESSPVALISIDTSLRIIMFNRTAGKLTGFSSEDVVGRRITKLVSFDRVRDIVRTLRERRQISLDGYITRLRGNGGREIPVRVKVSPVFNSDNRLIGILLLVSDLREIRNLQSKLLEAERLSAITETAIGVNHEINNPLCSMLGNTQLLLMEKENLDPGMVKKLRSIEKQIARIQVVADRLGKITNPVLKEYIGGKKMLDVHRSGEKKSRPFLKK